MNGYFIWALSKKSNAIYGDDGESFPESEFDKAVEHAEKLVDTTSYDTAFVVKVNAVFCARTDGDTQCKESQATMKPIVKYFQRIFATREGN
jgi:hypothetical protein